MTNAHSNCKFYRTLSKNYLDLSECGEDIYFHRAYWPATIQVFLWRKCIFYPCSILGFLDLSALFCWHVPWVVSWLGFDVFSWKTLTSFYSLMWAESRIYWCWSCFWTGAQTKLRLAKSQRRQKQWESCNIGKHFFCFSRRWVSPNTQWEHSVAATLGDNEDPLPHVSSNVKRCLSPAAAGRAPCSLPFPLMLQKCPQPYQAGPSHRLECKHSAGAQGASVQALRDSTATTAQRTCWFEEQTCEELVGDQD